MKAYELTDEQKAYLKRAVASIEDAIDECLCDPHILSDELIEADDQDEICQIRAAAYKYLIQQLI